MKKSLKTQILTLVLLPIIILGGITIITSNVSLKKGMYDEIKAELRASAVAGLHTYEYANTADYVKNQDGTVSKGEALTLSNDYSVVDNLKDNAKVDATFFYQEERILTTIKDSSGNRLIGTKASNEVVNHVLDQGKDYFVTDIKINGTKYFGYYIPVKQPSSGDVIGMFFTGISQSKVNNLMNHIRMQMIFITLGVIVVFFVISYILAHIISRSIKRSVATLEAVAEGNLEVEINELDLKGAGEAGDCARATLKLRDSLRKMIGDITETSKILTDSAYILDETIEQTSATTEDVERAIEEISNGAMTQASETQEAKDKIIVMGNMIADTVAEVDKLNTNSEYMKNTGNEALKTLLELQESNEKTITAMTTIENQTNTTNESAQEIRQAAEIIASIARETNLLSLNASIEAARAGEQGRGFAVVAAQIQKLAEQSNDSVKQINSVVNNLLQDSNQTVQTMNEVKDIVLEQSNHVIRTKEMFENVSEGITVSIEGVNQIAEKSNVLDESRSTIIDIVQGLSAIAEENAASAEETSAATEELNATVTEISGSAEELKKISDRLMEDIKKFKM
ncbi:methyl-accepting chemotaxis protein [Anaeromicropila herbilytica]|uniref:Methyl-accepting chemotaxis protein n=1 Tax=Anaeromicropila herbilytica TaxID=2785025 RepID=A0A7R7EPN8_9FIRM|nr:cache domain-containing protein [Anaeromicropila herbilytica]BCN32728.1 methyl-accepting chemotaxis protein [Anaeromicropila herbilytica]